MEEQQNFEQEQTQTEEQVAQEPVMQADSADVEKNKTMAILAYFIFFLPLLTDAKDSPFAKFHANQSLVLFLFVVAVNIIGAIIPFLGWFIVLPIGSIMAIVFWIMGLMNAANGKMKELPMIGGIHILDK